jgi:hypothetical protein
MEKEIPHHCHLVTVGKIPHAKSVQTAMHSESHNNWNMYPTHILVICTLPIACRCTRTGVCLTNDSLINVIQELENWGFLFFFLLHFNSGNNLNPNQGSLLSSQSMRRSGSSWDLKLRILEPNVFRKNKKNKNG